MDWRATYEHSYARGRSNLLLMSILTAVNIVLILANADRSFPFSAFFPQIAIAVSAVLAQETANSALLAIGIALTVLSLGVYFLCYLLSKKSSGWLIAALVLFSLDTLFLAYTHLPDFNVSYLLDFVFHAWVLFYLIAGVRAAVKLRQLPPPEFDAAYAANYAPEAAFSDMTPPAAEPAPEPSAMASSVSAQPPTD